MPAPTDRFLLGVNYWPRRKAMWWWKRFRGPEVAKEFRQIASLRLQLVRLFLLWEDFQPAPDRVDPGALSNFKTVLNIAHAYGLLVMPTLIVGHMSGPNWLPAWALKDDRRPSKMRLTIAGGRVTSRRPRDLYSDEPMLAAQSLLAREVVAAAAGHPALYGWDLGNEINLAQEPASYEAARRWVELLTAEIKRIDPARPVTCGALFFDLQGVRGFRVADVAAGDFVSVHAYPDWTRRELSTAAARQAIGGAQAALDRPVFLTEFGVPTAGPEEPARSVEIAWKGRRWQQWLHSERDAADYYEQVLAEARGRGCLGALAWCYSDYAPSLHRRLPFSRLLHERYFGITRADGTLKPCAHVLRQFAR